MSWPISALLRVLGVSALRLTRKSGRRAAFAFAGTLAGRSSHNRLFRRRSARVTDRPSVVRAWQPHQIQPGQVHRRFLCRGGFFLGQGMNHGRQPEVVVATARMEALRVIRQVPIKIKYKLQELILNPERSHARSAKARRQPLKPRKTRNFNRQFLLISVDLQLSTLNCQPLNSRTGVNTPWRRVGFRGIFCAGEN